MKIEKIIPKLSSNTLPKQVGYIVPIRAVIDSLAHMNHTLPLKTLTKIFNIIFFKVCDLDLKVTNVGCDGTT